MRLVEAKRFALTAVGFIAVAGAACGCASSATAGRVGDQPGSGVPQTSATTLVPWIDAPPPPYRAPATSTPPGLLANARPCRAADVSAKPEKGSGAGGHSVTYVRFRNVSRSPCLLAGYPAVTATEPHRTEVAGTDGSFFDIGRPANLSLGGSNTLLGLESDAYCAARPGGGGGGADYRSFVITMPGGGAVSITVPDPGLDLTCGLHLTHFFDPDYPQPVPVYPLDVLTVRLVLPATGRAGHTLRYEVDLHNPSGQPVDLEPCPGYVEALGSAASVKKAYALNCTPVASLAPGDTARFAMELPVPAGTSAGPVAVEWGMNSSQANARGTVLIA